MEEVYENNALIIPYQELLGNYDARIVTNRADKIIPYQELLGNYDIVDGAAEVRSIIPYQELLGNYDPSRVRPDPPRDYTIPRAIREL